MQDPDTTHICRTMKKSYLEDHYTVMYARPGHNHICKTMTESCMQDHDTIIHTEQRYDIQ